MDTFPSLKVFDYSTEDNLDWMNDGEMMSRSKSKKKMSDWNDRLMFVQQKSVDIEI